LPPGCKPTWDEMENDLTASKALASLIAYNNIREYEEQGCTN